jgi:O-acetyl-ADP-ribose deacetylase (regulator of RNase III)
MRLILADASVPVCLALEESFGGLPGVEVVRSPFADIPEFDCIVSPGNSFGLMDGGVDAAISCYFGWDLQERVQRRILDELLGEQPVGTSLIVETGHPEHPFLAHTPTMRVPMPVAKTDNKLDAGHTTTVTYKIRARFPIKARTPLSQAYPYYDPKRVATSAPQDIVVK